MTTSSCERDLRQRPQTAGGWRGARAPRSARAADASFARPSSVFESLAIASVLIWQVATTELACATAFEPDRLQQLRRPLFIVDQGLRFTAAACDLGRELVASIQGHR